MILPQSICQNGVRPRGFASMIPPPSALAGGPLVHPADLEFASGSEADGEPDVAGIGEVVFDQAVGQEDDLARLSGDETGLWVAAHEDGEVADHLAGGEILDGLAAGVGFSSSVRLMGHWLTWGRKLPRAVESQQETPTTSLPCSSTAASATSARREPHPHRRPGTRAMDSSTIRNESLDAPCRRSWKMMGISRSPAPARQAAWATSIWKP